MMLNLFLNKEKLKLRMKAHTITNAMAALSEMWKDNYESSKLCVCVFM